MRGVIWAGVLAVGLAFAPSAMASCDFQGKSYSKGKTVTVYAGSSVPSGAACKSVTLTCKTTGAGKKKSIAWHLGSTNTRVKSVSGYFSECAVQAPAPSCPAGKVSVNYSFTDADSDNYYKAESGSLCLLAGLRLPTAVSGVRYASTVATTSIEPAECDSDRSGVVAVNYGAVDRDGDGYFVAENGRTCLMSDRLSGSKVVGSENVTFAAAVPAGRSEPDAGADRNSLVPIGSFALVAPSEQGSGVFNGVEGLYYDYFAPGLGFHYFNSIRQESMWSPEFMVHGVRVGSVAGGSGEFSYWIQSFTETYEAGSPQLAQVDGAGRVVISCGVAPGTEFELRVRDSRTGVQQGHRFRSAGDGPACAPEPNPTPTPELCLDPSAMNYWTEGKCNYPEPTPTVTPTIEPGPTETGCPGCEPEESKCPSEEDSSVKFYQPGNAVVTKYGYEGDPYSDSASAAGIASCTAHADLDGNGVKDRVDFLNNVLKPSGDDQAVRDWLNGVLNKNYAPKSHFLKNGDIALSPDLSAKFSNCGEIIEVKVETGVDEGGKPTFQCFTGRVWDKTADYLKGRVDVYAPSGAHELDGKKVVGIRKVQ